MEKEFVPYDLALRMKQLGFDESCMASRDMSNTEGLIQVPTYSQAFRWFREKYDLHSLVCFDKQIDEIDDEELENPYFTYYYSINELWTKGKDYNKFTRGFVNIASNRDILSHEEAELDCLEKLIEIVEQKEKEL
jgi:hypothetical protein